MLKNLLSMTGLSVYRSVLQVSINLALTRFITPADYGSVAFVIPFTAFLSLLSDFGLSNAVVRHPEVTRQHAGAVLTFMLAVGGVGAVAMVLAAFPLAQAVHIALVAPIMIVSSLSLMLAIASSTPRAMMERELAYPAIAAIEASSSTLAAVVAVVGAVAGAGVWALVAFNLLTQTCRCAGFGLSGRGHLSPNLRWGAISPLMQVGGWTLAFNVQNFLARNADNLIVGVLLGAVALGFYSLSYQVMLLPLMAVTWPAVGVLLATLPRLRHDMPRTRELVAATIATTALLTFPVMGLAAFALRYPVESLLSPSWAGVPPLVAWLAPTGALQSVAGYVGAVLLGRGRAQALFWLGSVNTLFYLSAFLLTAKHGLLAMVISYSAVTSAASIVSLWILIDEIELPLARLAGALAVPTLATGAALMAQQLAASLPMTEHGGATWLVRVATFAGTILLIYGAFMRPLWRHLTNLKTLKASDPTMTSVVVPFPS